MTMNVRFACLSVGLALAVLAQPASAADWNNGGESIKDMSGSAGVPVPAPVPVADYAADWYIGVVTGGVLSDDSSITEVGTGMPVRDSSDLAKTMFGGISAGRYLTPSLRAEIAFDFYDDFTIAGPNEVAYPLSLTSPSSGDVAVYDVTRTDTVKIGRTTGMFNLFYDIPVSQRFKPYIGAGVGVTWRSIKRKYSVNGACDHVNGDPNCSSLPTDLEPTFEENDTLESDRFDVALAAMAGFTIEVTPSILWDNGYQLLWESNSIEMLAPTYCGSGASCDSTVKYADTMQHQFRTGLRFLID